MEPMAFKYQHIFGGPFFSIFFLLVFSCFTICVIFCCTKKWICYTGTYILFCHHRSLSRIPSSITWVLISYLFYTLQFLYMGFSSGSAVKNQPANVGEAGSIPGLGRFPGEGDGYPLQYSCLRNPMDRGAWWSKKGQTQLSDQTTTVFICQSQSPNPPHTPSLVLASTPLSSASVSLFLLCKSVQDRRQTYLWDLLRKNKAISDTFTQSRDSSG